ncbi:MAG: cadherin domain-containing protein [Bacteroidota bacterium]
MENQTFTVEENTPSGSTFGRPIEASDPEESSLTYRIVSGNELNVFSLLSAPNAGVIRIDDGTPLDYEVRQSIVLTIEVEDNRGNTSQAEVTIEITNVDETGNDAPELIASNFIVDENTSSNTKVGDIQGSDIDGDAITYKIISGNTDNAFALNQNTGELTVNNSLALDFEVNPSFDLLIEVSDAEFAVRETINISVLDQNESPTIEDQSFTIEENAALDAIVGQLQATDVDGDELVYEVSQVIENEIFNLSTGGVITVAKPEEVNHEVTPTYTFEVRVSDGETNSVADVTINISDINDEPTDIILSNSTIEENSAIGIRVGMLSTTDEDVEDGHIYELSGTDAVSFELSNSEFGVELIADRSFDFEVKNSFNISITTIDLDEATFTKNFSISITDVNEAPSIENQTFTVAEESPNETLVGQVVASDPEGDNLTFSIASGNDDEVFAIDPSTGNLTVNNSVGLDFETSQSFELMINVADDEFSDTAVITISLTDVEENNAPTVSSSISDQNLNEGFLSITIDLSTVFTDVDGDDLTFSVAVVNTDIVIASISGTTLTVSEGAVGTTDITVTAEDGNGERVSDTFNVTVNDVLSVNKSEISVYPNPATDRLYFNSSRELIVEVLSLSGQTIKKQKVNSSLDLNDLNQGTYLIKIQDGKDESTHRIIKAN